MKLEVTDDQYQRAARRICELRGINPDETLLDEVSGGFRTNTFIAQRELINLIMMLEALDEIIEADELLDIDDGSENVDG